MKKSASNDLEDKCSSVSLSKMLESNENIRDIQGGPFHSVALTSKGKVLYSGNFYRTDELMRDGFTNEFVALNTASLGKITSIRCSLNGVCLLTL
jgi:hypothetical protein